MSSDDVSSGRRARVGPDSPEGALVTGELFAHRVEVVSWLTDLSPVTVPNTSDATYARDRSGRLWVRKRVEATGWPEIVGEALGLLLGRELGVPIPEGAVCLEPEEESWLSLVRPNVSAWSPSASYTIENIEGFAAMLVLDAVLANTDRHGGNILLEDLGSASVRAWAIDQGNVEAAHPGYFRALERRLPPTMTIPEGMPLVLLREPALEAAEAAEKLSSALLRSIAEEACDLGREEKAREKAVQGLQLRCASAVEITEAYLARIDQEDK